MTTTTRMLLWQAITPLHVGTGQSGAGIIDLPVAREASTGFPVLPAPGVKGAYRDGADDEEANLRFGFAKADEQRQGALTFFDARLFALAVPSFRGTYALVTCPLVVRRLNRERTLLGLPRLPEPVMGEREALVTGNILKVVPHSKILLQDYELTPSVDDKLRRLGNDLCQGLAQEDLAVAVDRLVMVGDDIFSFLCQTAMDVSAHVRLKPDTKTVERGALWWEECIPAESLLTSLLVANDPNLFEGLGDGLLQVGGKSTVGRGLVNVTSSPIKKTGGHHG